MHAQMGLEKIRAVHDVQPCTNYWCDCDFGAALMNDRLSWHYAHRITTRRKRIRLRSEFISKIEFSEAIKEFKFKTCTRKNAFVQNVMSHRFGNDQRLSWAGRERYR